MSSPNINDIHNIIDQYVRQSTKKLEADFENFRSQMTAKCVDLQEQLTGTVVFNYSSS